MRTDEAREIGVARSEGPELGYEDPNDNLPASDCFGIGTENVKSPSDQASWRPHQR